MTDLESRVERIEKELSIVVEEEDPPGLSTIGQVFPQDRVEVMSDWDAERYRVFVDNPFDVLSSRELDRLRDAGYVIAHVESDPAAIVVKPADGGAE